MAIALLQVRVYVDGQLAGFYPISYTMYTVRDLLKASIIMHALYSRDVYTLTSSLTAFHH
jgi:hypothetical protein